MLVNQTQTNSPQPAFHLIIQADEILESWQWFISNINARPAYVNANNPFIYDRKSWDCPAYLEPLHSNDHSQITNLARLFIMSQTRGSFNDFRSLFENNPDDIGIFTDAIDESLHKLFKCIVRFRYALSEHLAFWVQSAHAVSQSNNQRFSITLPNFLPEDKGPDGLFLSVDISQNSWVEIRSVKSSTQNPQYLIVSPAFRKCAINHNPKKQLDEFHCFVTGTFGFIRLERLVSDAYNNIGLTANQFLRATLLKNTRSFNAMVVANDSYGTDSLFQGYHQISTNPQECIATYISTDDWFALAENVRSEVIQLLSRAGVW